MLIQFRPFENNLINWDWKHQCPVRHRTSAVATTRRAKIFRGGENVVRISVAGQATDERIGRYKADRFRHAPRIIDYCCGLGGDLLNLLTVASSVTGVDQSPLACKLARFNCQANQRGVEIEQRAVDPASFKCDSWFHIDPDRRATGSRTINLDRYEPSLSVIEQLVQTCRSGAIKVAPATRIPQTWRARVERQWIGGRRDCKQQVVWSGDTTDRPAYHTAVAVDDRGHTLFEIKGLPDQAAPAPLSDAPPSFLYDPHPAIIASGLVDSLAQQYGLRKLATDTAYLMSEQPSEVPGLTRFEILEVVKLRTAVIVQSLKAHQCGNLEIKKRGVDHHLMQNFDKLGLAGHRDLTLVLTRMRDRHVALICQRS